MSENKHVEENIIERATNVPANNNSSGSQQQLKNNAINSDTFGPASGVIQYKDSTNNTSLRYPKTSLDSSDFSQSPNTSHSLELSLSTNPGTSAPKLTNSITYATSLVSASRLNYDKFVSSTPTVDQITNSVCILVIHIIVFSLLLCVSYWHFSQVLCICFMQDRTFIFLCNLEANKDLFLENHLHGNANFGLRKTKKTISVTLGPVPGTLRPIVKEPVGFSFPLPGKDSTPVSFSSQVSKNTPSHDNKLSSAASYQSQILTSAPTAQLLPKVSEPGLVSAQPQVPESTVSPLLPSKTCNPNFTELSVVSVALEKDRGVMRFSSSNNKLVVSENIGCDTLVHSSQHTPLLNDVQSFIMPQDTNVRNSYVGVNSKDDIVNDTTQTGIVVGNENVQPASNNSIQTGSNNVFPKVSQNFRVLQPRTSKINEIMKQAAPQGSRLLENCSCDMNKMRSQLTASLTEEFRRTREAENLQLIARLKTEHAADIHNLKLNLERQHELEIADLKNFLLQAPEESKDTFVSDLAELVKNDNRKEVELLEKEKELEIQRGKERLAEFKKMAERQHNLKISELKKVLAKENEDKLSELRAQLKKSHEEKMVKLKEAAVYQHNEKMKELEDRLCSEKATEKAQLKMELEREKESELAELKAKLTKQQTDKLSALKADLLKQHNQQISNLQAEILDPKNDKMSQFKETIRLELNKRNCQRMAQLEENRTKAIEKETEKLKERLVKENEEILTTFKKDFMMHCSERFANACQNMNKQYMEKYKEFKKAQMKAYEENYKQNEERFEELIKYAGKLSTDPE